MLGQLSTLFNDNLSNGNTQSDHVLMSHVHAQMQTTVLGREGNFSCMGYFQGYL